MVLKTLSSLEEKNMKESSFELSYLNLIPSSFLSNRSWKSMALSLNELSHYLIMSELHHSYPNGSLFNQWLLLTHQNICSSKMTLIYLASLLFSGLFFPNTL